MRAPDTATTARPVGAGNRRNDPCSAGGIRVEGEASARVDDVTVDNTAAVPNNVYALSTWMGEVKVVNSSFAGKDIDVAVGRDSKVSLYDVAFDQDSVEFQYPDPGANDFSAFLRVGWYLDVHVEWQNNAPISRATVDIETDGGALVHTQRTDIGGNATAIPVVQYDRAHYNRWANFTHHKVNVTKNGVHDFQMVTMDQNRAVTVMMTDIADPFLNITYPADDAIFADGMLTVNGTSADPESGIVTVDLSTNAGVNWSATDTIDDWANWEFDLNLTDGD